MSLARRLALLVLALCAGRLAAQQCPHGRPPKCEASETDAKGCCPASADKPAPVKPPPFAPAAKPAATPDDAAARAREKVRDEELARQKAAAADADRRAREEADARHRLEQQTAADRSKREQDATARAAEQKKLDDEKARVAADKKRFEDEQIGRASCRKECRL